jgi:hypothetical protein
VEVLVKSHLPYPVESLGGHSQKDIFTWAKNLEETGKHLLDEVSQGWRDFETLDPWDQVWDQPGFPSTKLKFVSYPNFV